MESAELKNQRLKEVFQTKIQEFRKVCYTLTGYQVDITTENQYRLTSMYAEQKADCLIFKVGRGAPRAPPCPLPSASAPPQGGPGLRVSVLWGLRNREKVREGPSARPRVQLDGGGRDSERAPNPSCSRGQRPPGRGPREGFRGPTAWLGLCRTRWWEV